MEAIKKFKVLWEIIPKKDKIYYIAYTIISIIHSLLFVLLPFLYRDIINAVTTRVYPEEKVFFLHRSHDTWVCINKIVEFDECIHKRKND